MSERPIFKCKQDQIEAHYYKTIAENLWVVQCFACGAQAIYNTETRALTPYNKGKARKGENSIVLDRIMDDEIKGGTNDSKSLPLEQ